MGLLSQDSSADRSNAIRRECSQGISTFKASLRASGHIEDSWHDGENVKEVSACGMLTLKFRVRPKL